MLWFWATIGGVIVAFLVFGAAYDLRAKRRGEGRLEIKEPSRQQVLEEGYGNDWVDSS